MEIVVERKIEITEKNVECLLCTAFYGINYWAEGMYVEDYGSINKDDIKGLNSDEAYAKILFAGGSLKVTPAYKGDFDDKVFNLNALANGIKKAIEKYAYCVDVDDVSASDAVGADIIIQLSVFDDIVYG